MHEFIMILLLISLGMVSTVPKKENSSQFSYPVKKQPIPIQFKNYQLRKLHSKLKKQIKYSLAANKYEHRMNKVFNKFRNFSKEQINERRFPMFTFMNLSTVPTPIWVRRLYMDIEEYVDIFASLQKGIESITKKKKIRLYLIELKKLIFLLESFMKNVEITIPSKINQTLLENSEVFLWAALQRIRIFLRDWRNNLASPTLWIEGQ